MRVSRSEIEGSNWFRKEEYPFVSKYIDLSVGKLHYIDEGEGEAIVFVHGTPSWSYEFRQQVLSLRDSHRCIVFDHFGFGLSDRPDAWDYSVESHRKILKEFIAKLGLKNFTLILHDFGGPIGLPLAIETPEKVSRIVISNSWFWPFETVDPKFAKSKRWLDTGLMKFLYMKMNFSAKFMVKMAWGSHRQLDQKTHDQFCKLFPNSESRRSTWELAQAIIHTRNDFADFQKKIDSLRKIPILFLWGGADKLIDTQHLEQWRTLLPKAEYVIFPEVGHFVFDEAPDLVIPRLSSFLKR
jgi:pimeloyl-ACP methyl ester carboxylesterase